VSFCVLFVCKCVLYYCQRVTTQLQLINISFSRIVKMDLLEVECVVMDWIELAQDRDRWRALVSRVMNLQVPKMRGIS